MASESGFFEAYNNIKSLYQMAMSQMVVAITHEEQNRPLEAIKEYERNIELIDEIFVAPVELPDDIDTVKEQWYEACMLIENLKKAKIDVGNRLRRLHSQHPAVVEKDLHEAEEAKESEESKEPDEEAKEADESVKARDESEEPVAKKKPAQEQNGLAMLEEAIRADPKTYKEIIGSLRDVLAIRDSGVIFDTMFQADSKLYKIHANGEVTSLSKATPTSIVMCTVEEGKWLFLNGVCFLQCVIPSNANNSVEHDAGEPSTSQQPQTDSSMVWIYPLIPHVTSCYSPDRGTFIFPDMESDEPGSAFGLLIQEFVADKAEDQEYTEDFQKFFLDLLEAILAGSIDRVETLARLPRSSGERVSQCIVTAAGFIAGCMEKGAQKTGELMHKSTPYIISKMRPAGSDAPPVSSAVQNSVEVAKNVTSIAAGVTGWIADKVGTASSALGRFLSPHVQTHGQALLVKGFGYEASEAKDAMEWTLTVAAGAVEGASTVFMGLEKSASILGTNISENSVRIIEHKYGSSAGDVAAGTFETLGNAFHVSQNVNYITPKGLAKKVAKNAGKTVVADYKLRQGTHVPAGSLTTNYESLRTQLELEKANN